jgi:hypothetical protein
VGALLDRGSLIGWIKKARLIYTPQVSTAAILDGNSLAGATVTLARILTASSIAGADVARCSFPA